MLTIERAIDNLQQHTSAWERELKTAHPNAALKLNKRKGAFNYTAYQDLEHAPKGSISLADAEANVMNLITALERLKTEHPYATIHPEIKKHRWSIFAILSSQLTGVRRDFVDYA